MRIVQAFIAGSMLLCAADAGKDWGVEKRSWTDPVTGVRVWEMTANKGEASNLYFHFPNLTRDGKYVLFTSNRSGSNQIFRMTLPEGRILQLTDAAAIGGLVPDPTAAHRIYYMRGSEVVVLDVESLAERVVGRVEGASAPTISGDGKWLALQRGTEIGRLNTDTGEYKPVIRVGFRIGHVQHHPKQDILFFVWETGGYAPQRSWLVNADGSGLRPFYQRVDPKDWFTPLKEWLTHEAWVMGTGEMTMIIDKVGIVVVNTDGTSRLVREGRYWHAHARPDGKFLVADDFDGQLWLIETSTGNARLVATGLRVPKAPHLHPAFDWDGRYVVFNLTKTHKAIGVIDLNDLPAQGWR